MSRHDIQLQAEQESDQIAEDFLDNKIESVEQFLEQFMVSNSSYSAYVHSLLLVMQCVQNEPQGGSRWYGSCHTCISEFLK